MKSARPDFLEKCFDPYDPWMSPRAIRVRQAFYQGRLSAKISAALIVLIDWLAPKFLRKVMKIEQRSYPITVAQKILAADSIEQPRLALEQLMSVAVPDSSKYGAAWGLGFPWMSKNGLYNSDIPFITHTPYAMEALCRLMTFETCHEDAQKHFSRTWQFLESLFVLHEDSATLALSYAPTNEPRIVINANSSACFAYCLHADQDVSRSSQARERALRIARYVVQQQQTNGAWHYYADDLPGNFIDCFHSCFVIKNLIKASKLDDDVRALVAESIQRGKQYIDENFFDRKKGLVKRFTARDIKDPFVWDLYDQAEYLGILIELSELDRAEKLCKAARASFVRNGDWYSKIDILGFRWGKNFSRWGISPFHFSENKLKKLRQSKA